MKKFILGSGSAWLAEFSILIIVGLTPLFFNYFYPTSIDLSKIVIFKIFTMLLFFSVIWRLSSLELSINKNIWRILWPMILLFIFLTLSLFLSIDITTSWFGSFERQEGLISWFFYGLWAILLILHFTGDSEEEKNLKIRRLFIVASISGFLVSIYAILQIIGVDFITWSEPAKLTGRAVSSFGQPNYLACWLLIILPFTAYLFFNTKNNLIRGLWSLFFVTELGALLATGSRSAFITFLVISILWSFWFFNKKKILSFRKIAIIILSGLVLTLFFASFLLISNPSRFKELTNIKKSTVYVRLELWKTGWQAFTKKPLFGYGLENQKEAYVKAYKVDWAIYARPNTYSDRAHNLILDTLLTSGIIGLVIFIYFLSWVYLNLLKAFKANLKNELPAFLIWSLSVYLFSLFFNFSITVTNIYFWLIVGLSIFLIGGPLVSVKNNDKKFDLFRLVLVVTAAILFIYSTFIEIKRLKADYFFNKSLLATADSEYFTALVLSDYLEETHPDPVSKSFYNQGLSLRFLESLPRIYDKSSFYVVLNYLVDTEKNIPDNNFENKFVKAFILGSTNRLYESQKMFNDLAGISPQLPKLYLAWGDVLLFNKQYMEAKTKFEKAFSLLPDINNPYLNEQQAVRLNIYQNQVEARLSQVNLFLK